MRVIQDTGKGKRVQVDILKCNLKAAGKRQDEMMVRKTVGVEGLWGSGLVRVYFKAKDIRSVPW